MFLHWTAGVIQIKLANLFLSGETSTDDVLNLYKRTGSDTLTEQALTWSPSAPTETFEASINPAGNTLVWHGVVGVSDEYFKIYSFNNSTSTLTELDSSFGTNQGILDVAWSPLSGSLSFVTIQGEPESAYVQYWTRSGDTFANFDLGISDPYEDDARYLAFNKTGDTLAIAYGPTIGGAIDFRIVSVSGTTFTDVLTRTESGLVRGMDFSPDGTKLAVSFSSSPYISIYIISGSTYTRLADSTFPSGSRPTVESHVAWNHDGTSLAVGKTIYNVSGDTFTYLTDLSVSGTVLNVKWAQDGSEIYVLTTASPYFYIFSRVNNTFTSVGTLDPAYDQAPNRILNYCLV